MVKPFDIGWVDGVSGKGDILVLRGEESIIAEYGRSIRLGDTVVTSSETSIIINVSYDGLSGHVSLEPSKMVVFNAPLFASIFSLLSESSFMSPISIGAPPTYEILNQLFDAIPDAFSGHSYWPQSIGPNDNLENKFSAPSAGESLALNVDLIIADIHARTNHHTLPDDAASTRDLNTGAPTEFNNTYRFKENNSGPEPSFIPSDAQSDDFADSLDDGNTQALTDLEPEAIDDGPIALTEDIAVNNIDVLGNDNLPDGATISSFDSTSANGAAIEQSIDGTFSYTPAPNYNGEDSFTYTLMDADADTDIATVSLVIVSVDDGSPDAIDEFSVIATEDIELSHINVTSNDILTDEATVSAFDTSSANGGSITQNPDGTFNYTSDSHFNGADSFTYTLQDVDGDTDVATVNLDVTAVSDGNPDAVDDGILGVTLNTTLGNINVVDNDSLADEASISSFDAATINGAVITQNVDGTFNYQPNAGFVGMDSFTYTVTDSDDQTDIGVVSVIVAAPAVAPTLVDTSDTVAQGSGLLLNIYSSVELSTALDASTIESSIASSGISADIHRSVNELGGADPTEPTILRNFSDINILDGASFGNDDLPLATFAITGLIYLEAGSTYSFQGERDGTLRIELGGKTLVDVSHSGVGGNYGVDALASDNLYNASSVIGGAPFGENDLVQVDSLTAQASGYYTLEIYYQAGGNPNPVFSSALLIDGVAHELDAENTNIFASVDEVINAGGQFDDFVAGATGDGGYFPHVSNIHIVGEQGTAISLSGLGFDVSGTDEIKNIIISDAPNASVLSDGTNTFTFDSGAGDTSLILELGTWDLSLLTLTPPSGYTDNIDLMVSATAQAEGGGGETTSIPVIYTIGILVSGYAGAADTDIADSINDGANDVVSGGAEADVLTASSDANIILYGFAGNDSLAGADGENILLGGAGHDVIDGGAGKDIIYGGTGSDTLTGGLLAGVDRFEGSDNNPESASDIFVWAAGDADGSVDIITDFTEGSSDDADIVNLSAVLEGESRSTINHFLNVSDATLTVDANGDGSGFDDLTIILSGISNDLATLIANGNIIFDTNNVIRGTSGNDIVVGTADTEIISGQAGSDTLTGGAGRDTFFWSDADGSIDTITDFDVAVGGDVLDLGDLLINEITQEVGFNFQNFNLQNYISVTTGINSTLSIDTDGDGSGTDISIVLAGVNLDSFGVDSESILQSMFVNDHIIASSDIV